MVSAETRVKAVMKEISIVSSGERKLGVREKEIDELERRFG